MPQQDAMQREQWRTDPARIDLELASQARSYDLLLGGKTHFGVDRKAMRDVLKVAPEVREVTRQNRRWLAEAIERMGAEGGIDQFLDLGAGLPAAENTHEIAQRREPDAKVVYVDHDLTAVVHGRALLADDRRSFYVDADIAEPASVLEDPVVAGALDLQRPVGILMGLVLHSIADPVALVEQYLAAVPSGSYLAITHPLNPRDGSRLADFSSSIESRLHHTFPQVRFRTEDEIARIVAGLELLAPGLVDLTSWWPRDSQVLHEAGAGRLLLVALGRKP
jgi:SAM-dependent methyltransferase